MLLPQGRRRSLFDYRVVAAYLAGTSAGALMTALTAWILSGFLAPLAPPIRYFLLVLGALLLWMVKQGPLSTVLSLPEARRQIPAEVFGDTLTRSAFRFGFELGTGVRTYIPSPAPYILLLALIVAHLPLGITVMVGLGFGLGRTVPLLVQVSANERLKFTREFLRAMNQFAPTPASLLILLGALRLV